MNTKRCEKHGIDYPEYTLFGFNRPYQSGFCPQCETEKEIESLAREYEKNERERIYKLERMNIEPMYYDSSLETFIASTSEQERAKKAVARLIETRSGKLVMLGSHGTGKTHLAVSAVREMDGKIFSMYEISTRIRATYSTHGEDEIGVVGELSRLPMLAIDEIGRTKGSDAETNWLSYIIDKRHVRGLPLILISNKHARKTCPNKDGCANCLENYISEDIMSRLREDGTMITFSGEDHRIVKRGEEKKPKTMDLEAIKEAARLRVAEKQRELEEMAKEYETIISSTELSEKGKESTTFGIEAFMKQVREKNAQA